MDTNNKKNTQNHEFGFVLVPKEVVTIVKLEGKPFTFADKMVYSYLLNWQNNNAKVYPSMTRMCEDLGVASRTSMTKYLNKLEALGLLEVTKVKGKSSTYKVLPLQGDTQKPNKDSLIRGTNIEKDTQKPSEQEPHSTDSYQESYMCEFTGEDYDEDQIPF